MDRTVLYAFIMLGFLIVLDVTAVAKAVHMPPTLRRVNIALAAFLAFAIVVSAILLILSWR